MWHFCKRCNKNWWSVKKEPKCCRWCGSTLWDKDKVRGVGAGRPKGSGWSETGPPLEIGKEGAMEIPKLDVVTVRVGRVKPVDVVKAAGKAADAEREDLDVGVDWGA